MIYLCENPLLKEHLNPEHVKYRLLGHLGKQVPPQDFTYVSTSNRLIKKYDLDLIFVGPATVARWGPGLALSRRNLFVKFTPIKVKTRKDYKNSLNNFLLAYTSVVTSPPKPPASIHAGRRTGLKVFPICSRFLLLTIPT
jgi:xylulose-5-phosphate/fructose-6-phosphate phosphoketolase